MDINIDNKTGVMYLTFTLFNNIDWLKHCFTTRIGGVSKGVCEGMNLSFREQDKDENVFENFRLISKAAGLSYDGITFSDQKHHTNLRTITIGDKGAGLHKPKNYGDIDGIMANEPDICLTTYYADCVPLYFVDRANKAIALSHAGWRGTAEEIGKTTVLKMAEQFGSKPEELLVGIGPCIGFFCFEVDKPVADAFAKFSFIHKYMKQQAGELNDKYLIDLAGVNKEIVMSAGVQGENIEIADMCTKCDEKLFFSHRRSGLSRGSMVAMMEITSSHSHNESMIEPH